MAANLPMVNIKLSPASGLSPGVYSKVKLIVRDEPTAAATAPGNPNKTSLPAAGIRWCGDLRTKQPQGQQRQDQFDPREQAQGHREAQAKQFAEEEAAKPKANKERAHGQPHRLSGTFSSPGGHDSRDTRLCH